MARCAFLALFLLAACSGPRIEAANSDSITVFTGGPARDFAGALKLAEDHCAASGRKALPVTQVAASASPNSGHYVTYHCAP